MEFGVNMFCTHLAIRPDELARAVEERGFESLWMPEHTHIPADRKGPTGDPLPEEYWHTYDPFVALTAAAMATKRLKICTGVCLVIERDPITTAKEVASLDDLSGGRFIFGIGAGWNREEMGNHGTAYASRYRLLKDRIQAMKAIWTQDVASYDGPFVKFGPMLSFPKPAQKPHPPIFLGGSGPKALECVADFCDGWIPLGFRTPNLVEQMGDLKRLCVERGRDPEPLTVSVFGAGADPAALEDMRKAGVARVTFHLPSAGRDKVLPLLDRYAQVMQRV